MTERGTNATLRDYFACIVVLAVVIAVVVLLTIFVNAVNENLGLVMGCAAVFLIGYAWLWSQRAKGKL